MSNYYKIPEFNKITKQDKLFQATTQTDALREAENEVMRNINGIALQVCQDIRRMIRTRLLSGGVQLIDDNAEIEMELHRREVDEYVLGTA